ncbi:MAG: acyl carrier protein [Bacteroidetes bacterium]|jgi:acyl carrier protein|nr:acyl carrier protein [Bacteroidota bacterium]MBT6686343.1 acyl carrier protein [Bacteroidota bacterium]MBT7142176.1 acyl carrier protein [Bacteroidota bacterium]MBT7490469.1 acyl carrier protein [Bacteroidota bacterium]
MNRTDIENIVNEFLIDEFEIEEDEITGEAHLMKDLGIESLDFVDIVVIIEKEFNFKVKREDLTDVKTLNNLYDYIEKYMN